MPAAICLLPLHTIKAGAESYALLLLCESHCIFQAHAVAHILMMYAHQTNSSLPSSDTTLYISCNAVGSLLAPEHCCMFGAIYLQVHPCRVYVGINLRLALLPPPGCHLPACFSIQFCRLQRSYEVQFIFRWRQAWPSIPCTITVAEHTLHAAWLCHPMWRPEQYMGFACLAASSVHVQLQANGCLGDGYLTTT